MTPQSDKKLFILDAMALLYRSYFAMSKNPRVNSQGLNTSAILGFANTILDLLKKEKPTHIAVAFDTQAPTTRHEAYADYKAHRERMPEDLSRSLPYVRQLLDALRIQTLIESGYEADDLAGTMAKQAEIAGFTVYMVTLDKDYGQLVTDHIFMYKPAHRGNAPEVLGVKEVCEQYGVRYPAQIIDWLGLGGDSSDNIPGVPGIGGMIAKKLLAQYNTIEDLVVHSDEIKPPRIGALLKEHAEQALFSKQLATIMLDAPIKFDEEAARLKQPDRASTTALLKELELYDLGNRLWEFYGRGDGAASAATTASASVADFVGTRPVASATADSAAKEIASADAAAPKAVPVQKSASPAAPTLRVLDTPVPDLFSVLEESEDTVIFYSEMARLWPDFATLQREFDAVFGTTEPLALAVGCHDENRWRYADMTVWVFAHPQKGIFRYNFDSAPSEAERKWFVEHILLRSQPWVVYQAKRLWHLCRHAGIDIDALSERCACRDVMLAHYVLDPENAHDFPRIAESVLHERCVPASTPTETCFQEASLLWRIWEVLSLRLQKTESVALFENMEMPLSFVLAQMEADGIKADPERLQTLGQILDQKMQSLSQEIYTSAGETFNIASPKQLGEILYDKLQITDKPSRTKTKQWSTSEETLQKLSHKHPIVEQVLTYRSLSKLKSSYAEALPLLIDHKTGHIHTTFNQAATATGRLSSTNPNLQNIPVRNELGREIRRAFVPYQSGDLLLSADYSQIELRIIASMSGDKSMQADFSGHKDVHTATAAKVFNVPIEEVSSAQRRMAKTVNFGIIYGMSAFGLADRLQIAKKEAADLIEKYFEQYAGLKTYIDKALETAREKGYVETLCHRRRYVPDVTSANTLVRSYAERNAINAPIQGSSADMIKLAMIRIARRLRVEGFRAKMVLQVHDELIFNVPQEEVSALQTLVETEMKQALPLQVPIEVEMQTAENWSDAH